MPAGRVDTDRLVEALESLADHLAATREVILDVCAAARAEGADPAAPGAAPRAPATPGTADARTTPPVPPAPTEARLAPAPAPASVAAHPPSAAEAPHAETARYAQAGPAAQAPQAVAPVQPAQPVPSAQAVQPTSFAQPAPFAQATPGIVPAADAPSAAPDHGAPSQNGAVGHGAPHQDGTAEHAATGEVDPWTPHPAGAWRPDRIGTDPQLGDEDAPGDDAPPAGTMVPRAQVASLQGVPLLSAGLIEAVIGPIADLPELDEIEAAISRFHGVEAAGLHRLEGSDALMLIELAHPIPLADMLREDLGRPVASCRLAEGRIVVELAPE